MFQYLFPQNSRFLKAFADKKLNVTSLTHFSFKGFKKKILWEKE